MGRVFQSYNLFGHMTVIENIMYAPVKLLGKSRQDAYDKGIELLKRVGLEVRALKYPDVLSGGQKQRVAIARALAMDPEIILFDEPTSALDPTMVSEVEAIIEDLARSRKTMMIVSHEMSLVRKVANRVFYLDEGVIYEEGSPDQIFNHPQRESTRRFARTLRVLEFNMGGHGFDFAEASARIDDYCIKNHIPLRTANRIRAVVEELCIQILRPVVVDADINVCVESPDGEGVTTITVKYPCRFNPVQMSSVEFFSMVREHLTQTGVMVVNMNMRSDADDGINTWISDTIASVFPHVQTVDVPGDTNRVLFAAMQRPDNESYQQALEEISTKDAVKGSRLRAFLGRIPDETTDYKGGGCILTDDRAPVEVLGMRAIDQIIEEKLTAYKELYREEGLDGVLDSIL